MRDVFSSSKDKDASRKKKKEKRKKEEEKKKKTKTSLSFIFRFLSLPFWNQLNGKIESPAGKINHPFLHIFKCPIRAQNWNADGKHSLDFIGTR